MVYPSQHNNYLAKMSVIFLWGTDFSLFLCGTNFCLFVMVLYSLQNFYYEDVILNACSNVAYLCLFVFFFCINVMDATESE